MYKSYFFVSSVALALTLCACQKGQSPVQPQSLGTGQLGVLEKKPSTVDPVIHLLRIADAGDPNTYWDLIVEDQVKTVADMLLDLKAGKTYNIVYEVSHPDGIASVEVGIWCDIIPNGYSWPHDGLLENSGDIFEHSNLGGQGGSVVHGEFTNWDGTVTPDHWDSDVYDGPYQIFDQWATTDHDPTTYADGDPSTYNNQSDHYGIRITVASNASRAGNPVSNFKTTETFLIQATDVPQPLGAFHVRSVTIVKAPKLKALVEVVKDDGGAPLPGAWVFGYWSGSAQDQYYYKGVTGSDGIAEIECRSGKSKDVSFTVRSVEKAFCPYNPWLNVTENPAWNWPENEPSGSL